MMLCCYAAMLLCCFAAVLLCCYAAVLLCSKLSLQGSERGTPYCMQVTACPDSLESTLGTQPSPIRKGIVLHILSNA